nr:reverse transcriptase domain-containing protein [Tanacetum cinerariifolium]
PLRIELPFLEDQFQEDTPPESPMADNRTMEELLQAPTEGYEDAIVIPEITAKNFKLNPTPFDDPIVSTTSPTLTPFRGSDFLLFEEADAFLGLEDDPDSPELDLPY